MDRESLTLIINGFDKKKFEQTVAIVLQDVLEIIAVNEDSLVIKKGVRIPEQVQSVFSVKS